MARDGRRGRALPPSRDWRRLVGTHRDSSRAPHSDEGGSTQRPLPRAQWTKSGSGGHPRAERRFPMRAVASTALATCRSMIRATSHALPVTSSATRSSDPRLPANSSSASGVVSILPAERTSPASTTATSQKSRWTSNPIDLTPAPFASSTGGEPVGKRHRRIRAHSTTGQVAGAATEKPGSKPIAQKPACPTCVLPESPLSQSAEPRPKPGQQPSERHSHAPTRSSVGHRSDAARSQRKGPPGLAHLPLGTRPSSGPAYLTCLRRC